MVAGFDMLWGMSESDVTAWARDHKACFQLGPLVEMRGSESIQVGFTLDLYARLPPHPLEGDQRAKTEALWERLRTIAESLAPEGGPARLEVEKRPIAAYLRPENAMDPEIGLRARIFHAAGYFTAVTPAERDRLSVVERQLTGMGLRSGRW